MPSAVEEVDEWSCVEHMSATESNKQSMLFLQRNAYVVFGLFQLCVLIRATVLTMDLVFIAMYFNVKVNF